MHADLTRLAAYLDSALPPDEHADLRAHLLACPACSARLARLRADEGRIVRGLAGGATPDVRAAVRARLRRRGRLAWLGPAAGIGAGLAALFVFALLLGGGRPGSATPTPAQLFVTDRAGGQLVALDPASGAQLRAAGIGEAPAAIAYDDARGRLYVALKQAVIALDPATLEQLSRWDAPAPIGSNANLALDALGGRLYVPQPGGIAALALDTPALALAREYPLSDSPQALALTPDGAALFALAPAQARLWSIDTASGASQAQVLAQPDSLRYGWLAASPDGTTIYALLTRASSTASPVLWQISRRDRSSTAATLALAPAPWDLALLGNGLLAVPRGNSATGGVELIATSSLSPTAQLEPEHDQHHIVAGPGGAFFGLNFSHGTITRYDAASRSVAWRTPERPGWQPWDGVYVPGRP